MTQILTEATVTVNVMLGLSKGLEDIVNRVIDLVAGNLSAEDVAALKASSAQSKATAAKADVADGKTA